MPHLAFDLIQLPCCRNHITALVLLVPAPAEFLLRKTQPQTRINIRLLRICPDPLHCQIHSLMGKDLVRFLLVVWHPLAVGTTESPRCSCGGMSADSAGMTPTSHLYPPSSPQSPGVCKVSWWQARLDFPPDFVVLTFPRNVCLFSVLGH